MKEYDSFKIIKKESFKKIVFGIVFDFFLGAFIIVAICGLIYLFIKNGIDKIYFYLLIILLPLLLLFFIFFLIILEGIKDAIKDYKHPLENSRFLRYGPPDKINEIIIDLNNNPIYSDSKIILNNKFICVKKRLSSLCALEDVIAVYKEKKYIPSRYRRAEVRLYYYDKFGKSYSVSYSYLFDNVKCVDIIIDCLMKRCKKAKFCNRKEIFDYLDSYKKEEEPEYYNNRIIKEIKVKKELVSKKDNLSDEEFYDEDLEDFYRDGDSL